MPDVIDAHVHIGESISLGMSVKPEDVIKSMHEAGVEKCLVFPFPSKAVVTPKINKWTLDICKIYKKFIPVFYVRDFNEYPTEDFVALKWHWVDGVSDTASNYSVLKNEKLPEFIKVVESFDLPIIFEEELEFTKLFIEKFPSVKLIIPHLGHLGGNPYDFLRTFKEFENIYFDTSLASKSEVRDFVDEIGEKRVIFGSDVPFGSMKYELSKLLDVLDKNELKYICSKNITELCRI